MDFFLTPIGPFLDNPEVTEVMVNGFDRIYIEKRGKIYETSASFPSEDALRSAINNLAQSVGRSISNDKPILDARLPDGSRVHAIIPPSARFGTYLTIRKFSSTPLTMCDLIEFGSLTDTANEFLELCVGMRKNIIISGGSGTGKTSMLGALSDSIPESERIIVIEDTSELRLHQKHCLYLETQPAQTKHQSDLTVRELFRSSLRMRPDRIVVGEVRGGEALDLIQSMISGHEGSLSTVHASSAFDALIRLETLSLMSEVEIPVHVARSQVASAIDIVVQLTRSSDSGRRRVSKISEVHRLDVDDQYITSDLFSLVPIPTSIENESLELDGLQKSNGLQNGTESRPRFNGTDLNEVGCHRLELELNPTGVSPTFASEPYLQGLESKLFFSSELWQRPGSNSDSQPETDKQ